MNDINNAIAAEDRDNILALIDNMEPIAGVLFSDEDKATRDRGRCTVRIMSELPNGEFTVTEVADVLNFLHESQGREPLDWKAYQEPHPVCGLSLVLKACERALRVQGKPAEGESYTASLQTFLFDRRDRASEAAAILRLITECDDGHQKHGYAIAAAYRLVHEVACSLDPAHTDRAARGDWRGALAMARRDANPEDHGPQEVPEEVSPAVVQNRHPAVADEVSPAVTLKGLFKGLRSKAHEAYLKILVASNTLEDCGVAENEGAGVIVKEVKGELWDIFEALDSVNTLCEQVEA